ncbi:MAG: LysR family transcriptional regulator [Kordiimonadaceae bacterium]|nr:LysR family transcriptional regulator [Kordiimonadaceae bacterium]MBO6570458.1 LysR family transcriptional regulator [Kordiimonadaceae bacterium]MBO6966423.1 LysR family transcriptional regulator [Kordiimonadaceae bacterium]
MDLNALALFAKVAETLSFSEASRRLNIPVSTVSRKIAELEDQLGVRLLERSTRSLRLTDVGEDVLDHARVSADTMEAVTSLVSNTVEDVKGVVRLSAPPSISDSLLVPIVSAFQAKYPDVKVRVMITNRLVDPIAEGIDIVLRVGRLQDSRLVVRKLLTYRHQLVAAPEYIKKHGMPSVPDELAQHRLLAFSFWTPERSWTFVNGSERRKLTIEPHLQMNDYAGQAEALLALGGIGDLPPIVLPHLMREGRLVEVMPEWTFRPLDLSLVHLGKKHMPRPIRLFKQMAVEMAPKLFPELPC